MYVQASTLGALEALLEFFKANTVPYSGIRVGPVVKRDVMKAAAMLEHDPMYAVILAFDVKVEKDAQELADKVCVWHYCLMEITNTCVECRGVESELALESGVEKLVTFVWIQSRNLSW